MLREPIVLGDQGSFFFGGSVTRGANGDTLHADAAYVKFQAPQNPTYPPIVMWHGGGQHSKTFETTPDGREGYQQIWVRRGHAVYIIDQAHRGAASKASSPIEVMTPEARDSSIFNIFRLGQWEPPGEPRFFPGVSFPTEQSAIDQFWFQVPTMLGHESHDEATRDFHATNMAALLDRIGPSILLSHSHSGAYGWSSAIKRPHAVKAVISYEPSVYAFPSDDPPPEIPCDSRVEASTPVQIVTPEQFEILTRIPIQIIFGDNIKRQAPAGSFASQFWSRTSLRADQFVEAVNRRGGQAEVLHLPQRGLTGNTHFPFADLNNLEVADLLSEFLARHKLGWHSR